MATIKEMARNASENYLGEAFEQGNFFDGYTAGANAVLEEVENALMEFSNTEDYSILHRLIKELKGE